MSEKEKRKHGEQRVTPLWIYSIFIFVLLITAPFPLFHLLDAYSYANEYQASGLNAIRAIGFIFMCVTSIWVYIEPNTRPRILLIITTLILCYATIFHDGVGLMIIGVILSPVAIIFPIYSLGLVVIRLKRPTYLRETLGLVSMACIIAIDIISLSWYMSVPYHVISSTEVSEESYHLILDSGFLDPTRIELHKCNHMGFFCEVIYTPNQNYYYDDNINWEISHGEETIITIFVNDEAIHAETIK